MYKIKMVIIMYFTIAFRTVLGIIDLIVSFSIAELAAISIEEPDKSIFTSILPITLLVILEIALSYIGMKNDKFRKMTDGSPSVIIDKGKINFKAMTKLRYTLDDLLTQMRQKDYKSIEDVKYAVLETDGELSIFADNYDYPLPLIVDGVVDEETLKNIKKNYIWLNEVLKSNNVKLEDVYYAFYRNNKTFIIKRDELL